MSAFPPKADILQGGLHVRYVPIADIAWDAGLAAMRSTQSESLLNSVGVGRTEQRWRQRVEALPAFVCKIVSRPNSRYPAGVGIYRASLIEAVKPRALEREKAAACATALALRRAGLLTAATR
jgi:hypothetical protein